MRDHQMIASQYLRASAVSCLLSLETANQPEVILYPKYHFNCITALSCNCFLLLMLPSIFYVCFNILT